MYIVFLRFPIVSPHANNQLLRRACGSGLARGKDVKERRHKPHSACKEGLRGRGGSLSSPASVLADVSAQMCKTLPFFFFKATGGVEH